jgi:DNA-binding PadR family transcriptional regulator
VAAALRLLAEDGLLEIDNSPTGGRPKIRYRLTPCDFSVRTIAHRPI